MDSSRHKNVSEERASLDVIKQHHMTTQTVNGEMTIGDTDANSSIERAIQNNRE